MKMTSIRDGYLLVFAVFFALLLEMHQSLYISNERLVKKANESIVVTCKDERDPKSVVKWSRDNGEELNNFTRPQVKYRGNVGWYLFFDTAQPSDSGTYICSNKKNEFKSFHLTVEAAIELDAQTPQSGREGQDVTIKCSGKGGVINWSLENSTINAGTHDRYQIVSDGLKIKNVTRDDKGLYTCKIYSATTGDMIYKTIEFTVLHKPVVFAKEEVKYGYISGTVDLVCQVKAEPPPSFNWFKKIGKGGKKKDFKGEVESVNEETSVAKIQIRNDHDFGTYMCVARNDIGEEDVTFTLERGEKPPRVEESKVISIGSEYIELELHLSNASDVSQQKGMEPNGFYVEYRESNTSGEWNRTEFDLKDDNIYKLEGLNPETEYEIRVASRNKAGPSDFNTIVNVKTNSGGVFLLAAPLSYYLLVNSLVIFFNTKFLLW